MNPMFERDFLGFAQKKRFFVLRTGIVAAPVLGLMTLALLSKGDRGDELGLSIFSFTTYPLLVLALLIAPALLAHSIVAERKLNTIEVLRTTTLSSWHIVWGKWFSRTLLLLLICVAALPLAASSLLFGGVAPEQILQFAVVIFGSVLWATSLALLVSCIAKDVTTSMRAAVVLVLFGLVGTAVLAAFLGWLLHEVGLNENYALALLQINPVAVLVMIQQPRILASLPISFMHPAYIYGLVCLLATAGFLLLSTRLVTAEGKKPFLMEKGAPLPAPGSAVVQAVQRPRRRWLASWLDRAPVVWLEVNQAQGRRKLWVRILAILLLVVLEIAFVALLADSWRSGRSLSGNAERTWPFHATACGAFLFMSFLAVISMGASAFRRDSDAKTLESLYATPLGSNDLLRGKVAGVLFAGLPTWLLAQAHALVAMALLALHPLAWLWWLLASTTLVLSATAFAMWVGLRAKNLLQANLLGMGGFAFWMLVLPIGISIMMAAGSFRGSEGEVVVNLVLGWHPMYVGMAPLFAGEPDHEFIDDLEGWWMTLIYLLCYAGVAIHLFKRVIPTLFRSIREGYEWQRSPIK